MAEFQQPPLVGIIDNSQQILDNQDGFSKAFFASFLMILVSEIGDKTFFIAAIMAMKNSRWLIFSGAFSALFIMTILSAGLGYALPNLLPRIYTHYAAAIFFLFFGFKMLREYFQIGNSKAAEELEEAAAEIDRVQLKSNEDKFNQKQQQLEEQKIHKENLSTRLFNLLNAIFSPMFIQTFTLTFLAEWGDRSQITTIAMAAAQDPYGITLGGILGHALCTGCAVIGGRLLAARISVKTVTLLGAILFLFFSIVSFYQGPEV
eukprot:TRINITY_DN1560_c2_g4_i1.p1 TRINITY_DN1560_c2_g4~~TRINITY_DN1560_c2_g4_i1.p1  ORF type:complete len:262 (-),score=131.51 TRINITY_DN1560_c2_g4_i1:151-936(-)